MKTDREIYDYVMDFLRKQGRQSLMRERTSGRLVSAYRGEDGCKCAVGCLIKDEFYRQMFEGHFFGKNLVAGAVMASFGIKEFPSSQHRMIQCLQHVHDTAGNDVQFIEKIEAYAARFNFNALGEFDGLERAA
jgi:hypothetical protein